MNSRARHLSWRLVCLLGALILLTACGCASEDDATTGDAVTSQTEPVFILGTNTVYENSPSAFTPLEDGDEIPVTLGSQGAWMVVLSFKTRGIFDGPLDVFAEVTLGDDPPDDFRRTDQVLFPGGDGHEYYYNLFLAMTRESEGGQPTRGTPAVLTIRVEDGSGHVVEERRDVVVGDVSN